MKKNPRVPVALNNFIVGNPDSHALSLRGKPALHAAQVISVADYFLQQRKISVNTVEPKVWVNLIHRICVDIVANMFSTFPDVLSEVGNVIMTTRGLKVGDFSARLHHFAHGIFWNTPVMKEHPSPNWFLSTKTENRPQVKSDHLLLSRQGLIYVQTFTAPSNSSETGVGISAKFCDASMLVKFLQDQPSLARRSQNRMICCMNGLQIIHYFGKGLRAKIDELSGQKKRLDAIHSGIRDIFQKIV